MAVPRRLLLGARDRLVLVVVESEVTRGRHVRGGRTAGARLRGVLQGIEAALTAVILMIIAVVALKLVSVYAHVGHDDLVEAHPGKLRPELA